MRLTDYADRLADLAGDGYSPAQARRLAGSGQRLPLEPLEDAADEDEAQEPGDMQGTAEGILNELQGRRSKER